MEKYNENIDKLVETLRQQRDELKLKMHLAKADGRDEWEKIEKKWSHLKVKADSVKKETEGATEDITSALKLVADEIKQGYNRIRKQF